VEKDQNTFSSAYIVVGEWLSSSFACKHYELVLRLF